MSGAPSGTQSTPFYMQNTPDGGSIRCPWSQGMELRTAYRLRRLHTNYLDLYSSTRGG
jgi:hypothetical protein